MLFKFTLALLHLLPWIARIFLSRSAVVRRHTNTKKIEICPLISFAHVFFLREQESHLRGYVKSIDRSPRSQKTRITIFAAFSDALRGISPKQTKAWTFHIFKFQSLLISRELRAPFFIKNVDAERGANARSALILSTSATARRAYFIRPRSTEASCCWCWWCYDCTIVS